MCSSPGRRESASQRSWKIVTVHGGELLKKFPPRAPPSKHFKQASPPLAERLGGEIGFLIGKMECFSKLFRDAVARALDAENRVIGSVAMKGEPLIQSVKARADVRLVEVTERNRDTLASLLLEEPAEQGRLLNQTDVI